jgi:pantoate--beta-alanine ligase
MDAAREVFASEPEVRIDYVAVVNPDTLEDVADTGTGALLAVAAYLGTTRLIDNMLV